MIINMIGVMQFDYHSFTSCSWIQINGVEVDDNRYDILIPEHLSYVWSCSRSLKCVLFLFDCFLGFSFVCLFVYDKSSRPSGAMQIVRHCYGGGKWQGGEGILDGIHFAKFGVWNVVLRARDDDLDKSGAGARSWRIN